MAELETSRTEALASAARELEQMRARFNSELGGLQTLLAERDAALEESRRTANATEQGLKNEILTLASRLEQEQALIESRDAERARRAGANHRARTASHRTGKRRRSIGASQRRGNGEFAPRP